MKKLFLLIATIYLSASLFSQPAPYLFPGTYKLATITVNNSGQISFIDSTYEIDPTVDVAVKGISNTDQDRWNKGWEAYTWGNPNGQYVRLTGDYFNPQWIRDLAVSRIAWQGTGLEYMCANGTYSVMPTKLSQFTNDMSFTSGTPTITGTGGVNVSSSGNTFTVNSQSYSAGTGISISGGVISNTATMVTPTITGSGSATVTSSGNTFTVNTPPATIYSAGTGISISGGVITNTSPNTNQTLSISGNSVSISGGNTIVVPTNTVIADYKNTAVTTGTAGVAVFYLTSDKTASGTALYSNVSYVSPVVNDVNGNYTFGWALSGDKKTLTVTSRVATNTAVIGILGISVLNSTVLVPAGTAISVFVSGN